MHQRPEPDFALAYAERVKCLVPDVGKDEARARASEHTVAAYDGTRPIEGVAMSHSASQTAMGASRAEPPADIDRGRPLGFPEASAAMTFYEFFAGAGMARVALGPAWTCLFANDIDPKKARSYTANFGDREIVVDDVATLTTADLPGVADLVWASPPARTSASPRTVTYSAASGAITGLPATCSTIRLGDGVVAPVVLQSSRSHKRAIA